MARSRNNVQWAHDVALIGLLGNALSKDPRPAEDFKPFKELDRG